MPAMPPIRKRRWFQFRLRTLLIGVVLIGSACGYVAHEGRLVRERRVMFTRYFKQAWFFSDVENDLPITRRWLGDVDIGEILFTSSLPQSDRARIVEAFPEAKSLSEAAKGTEPPVGHHDGRMVR